MADLAATDITVSIKSQSISAMSEKIVRASLAFGNGSLTYPTSGIPISKGALGLPNSIRSLKIYDGGSGGYVYSYDHANEKIRMFQRDAHAHTLNLKNAAVADGATTRVNAGSNLLGANTGSDITVAGAGANGGVQNAAAAALSELTNSVAPAAQTIYVEAVGY